MDDILHTIQQALKAPKNQKNNFAGFNYRSCEDILEAVKPLLPKGVTLTLSDEMVNVGQFNYIKATVTLRAGKDPISVSAFAREAVTKKGMDDSQMTGTASSYARKYALNGLFSIDDTKDADTGVAYVPDTSLPKPKKLVSSVKPKAEVKKKPTAEQQNTIDWIAAQKDLIDSFTKEGEFIEWLDASEMNREALSEAQQKHVLNYYEKKLNKGDK